ncbi:MAG: PAS domain-containing sensor histidine kinase [Gemmatimonadota bacterium]
MHSRSNHLAPPAAEREVSWYERVFTASPDGIVIVRSDGTIAALNSRAAEQFGYAVEELVDTSIERLVPDDYRSAHLGQRMHFVEHPGWRPMGVGLELRGRKKDGTVFPVEIALSPVHAGGLGYVIAMVRDLTEWARQRHVRAATVRAMERERQRIAYELHDDALQRLAATIIHLRLASRSADPELAAELLSIRDSLGEAADGIRRIASGLRPPEIEQVGLAAAVNAWIGMHDEEDGTPAFDLVAEPVDEFVDEEERLVLYRILQEAITNAVRHARARSVRVEIGMEEALVWGLVRDDGVGFNVQEVTRETGGLGLAGMSERAHVVGARLTIESHADGGTEVKVVLRKRDPSASIQHTEAEA